MNDLPATDLTDDEPPNVVIDVPPPDDSDERRGEPPAYPLPKPPAMGGVAPSKSGQPMGLIDPKIVIAKSLEVTPTELAELQASLVAQRADLMLRVESIESLLGFIGGSEELSVRVAKIERFVGMK